MKKENFYFWRKIRLNKEQQRIVIIILLIILVLIIVRSCFSGGRVNVSDEVKTYTNERYGFELVYPFAYAEKNNSIVFSGERKSDNVLTVNLYPDKHIQTVIDEFREDFGDRASDGRDVGVNSCTAHRITVDGKHHYFFITSGRSTFAIDYEDSEGERQQYINGIMKTFTCL